MYLSAIVFRVFCVFFFQAEDGIRDLVRSRGLGDVYKRQQRHHCCVGSRDGRCAQDAVRAGAGRGLVARHVAVSYTHLTLPTSDLV